MKTALTFLLAVAGLVLLPHNILLGCAVVAAAVIVGMSTSRRDEEAFVGLLMILGGLGAAATVVSYLWQRLT